MTKVKSRVQSPESRVQGCLKRIALRCALPLLLATQAWATTVYFPMQSFTGTAQNRRVFVTPAVNPITDGTNIIAGMPITLQPTNGFATNNFVASVYWITVEGVQTATQMTVTNAAVQLNAVWLCTNLTQFVYAPAGPGVLVAAGTNAVGYTNGGTIVIAGTVGFPAVTNAILAEIAANPSNWVSSAGASNIGAFEASINQQGNVLTNVGGLTVSNSLPNRASFNLNNMLNIFDYQAGHFLFSGFPILLDHGISSPGTGLSSEYYGQSASASGSSATALGAGATASGQSGSALANGATASGTNGTAVGFGAGATATDSTALGTATSAANTHSTALGKGAATDAANEVMLGTSSDTVVVPGASLTVRGMTGLIGRSDSSTNVLGFAPLFNSSAGNGSGLTNLSISNVVDTASTVAPSSARFDTNRFVTYYAGDTNAGNGQFGTVWTYAFVPGQVIYTNGISGYSNFFNFTSNQWIIASNANFLYSANPNTGTYGAVISGTAYAKSKGYNGTLPAPRGFIASGQNYSTTLAIAPYWLTTTGVVQSASYFTNRTVSALGLEAANYLDVGLGNLVNTDTNLPNYFPQAAVASFGSTVSGPNSATLATGSVTNQDFTSAIIASSQCTLYRGNGDDFMAACENCIAQHLGSSVCATIACFGTTNYSTGNALSAANGSGLLDPGCINFAHIGGSVFYDNVYGGLCSGSFQTNGQVAAAGSPVNYSIWDFGVGNTVQTPNTFFAGFTNVGLSIGTNTITATAGSSFVGNGSTLTNVCSILATNHISGQMYTNTGNSVWLVGASILLTNTAALGNVEMDLRITGANGITNPASLLIGVALTNRTQLTGPVAPGQTWAFTNTGSGNPAIIAGSGWIQKTGN